VQGFVNKTKNSPSKSPQPKQSLADALMSHHSNAQQPPASPDLNLTTVTDVGVAIPGTSSTYTSYMISDDCNIAYRWTGKGLSIRAEKFTPAAAKALEEWGLDLKKGKRPYASTHLQITDKKLVPRTLGSLVAGFGVDTRLRREVLFPRFVRHHQIDIARVITAAGDSPIGPLCMLAIPEQARHHLRA